MGDEKTLGGQEQYFSDKNFDASEKTGKSLEKRGKKFEKMKDSEKKEFVRDLTQYRVNIANEFLQGEGK